MTLDELERLEQAATPAPWQEVAESGDWWVEGAEGIGVCESNKAWNHQADIDLMIALRNTLPTLLRVARAAQAWRETWKSLDDAAEAVEARRRAREELFAALAALEGCDA